MTCKNCSCSLCIHRSIIDELTDGNLLSGQVVKLKRKRTTNIEYGNFSNDLRGEKVLIIESKGLESKYVRRINGVGYALICKRSLTLKTDNAWDYSFDKTEVII